MAADPQDAPRNAGQVARRALLRRNIVIDADPAQLVAAAVQAALQSGAPSQRPAPKAACSSRQLRVAVLVWQRLPGSFGARDTSVNGTPTWRKARKPRRPDPARPGRQPGRVALPGSGEGASRPRARARATASARVCVPSLPYRWVM
jgi:hypothetical protein